MLGNLWPLFSLTVQTSRLELRLPRDEEIAELASIAGRGVHHPGERPFLTSWTAGEPQDRARFVLQEHWSQLGTWSASAWRLGLGVFLEGQPLGVMSLRARDSPIVREVTTSSWLGLDHHRRGFGTEARGGLLTLAFKHLEAPTPRSPRCSRTTTPRKPSPASWATNRTASHETPVATKSWSPTVYA